MTKEMSIVQWNTLITIQDDRRIKHVNISYQVRELAAASMQNRH